MLHRLAGVEKTNLEADRFVCPRKILMTGVAAHLLPMLTW
jgi:hypothetical protein